MKKYRVIIGIFVIIFLGLAFVFWIFFGVISYRRVRYSYEVEGNYCSRDNFLFYYKKDGIRYYNACYQKITVVEERFIFRFKQDLKKAIDTGEFFETLQQVNNYKWAFPGGVQTDYYLNDSNDLMISKCSLEDRVDYYIYYGEDRNLCYYLYQ